MGVGLRLQGCVGVCDRMHACVWCALVRACACACLRRHDVTVSSYLSLYLCLLVSVVSVRMVVVACIRICVCVSKLLVVCGLSLAARRVPFVVSRLSCAGYRCSIVVCRLPVAVCRLLSVVCRLP